VSVRHSLSALPSARQVPRRVTRRSILLAVGLCIYVASFFLSAVRDFGWFAGEVPGYVCAEVVLIHPFSEDGRSLLHEKPLEHLALFGSGLINSLFLTTFFIHLFRGRARAFVVLRNLTILMIPLCWIVFLYEHLYPREGHVLWVLGMILAMFAMSDSKLRHLKERTA
jgi:uncharacterized membrane protein